MQSVHAGAVQITFSKFLKSDLRDHFWNILGVIWEGFGIILGPVGLMLGAWVDFRTKKEVQKHASHKCLTQIRSKFVVT